MDEIEIFDVHRSAGFVWFQLRHVVAYGFHGVVSFLWCVILLDIWGKVAGVANFGRIWYDFSHETARVPPACPAAGRRHCGCYG